MPPIKRSGAFDCYFRRNYFFRDSSIATATETVMPTMGLLPAAEAYWERTSSVGFHSEKWPILAEIDRLIIAGYIHIHLNVDRCGRKIFVHTVIQVYHRFGLFQVRIANIVKP